MNPCFIEMCPAPRLMSNFGTNSGFTFLYPCSEGQQQKPFSSPVFSTYTFLICDNCIIDLIKVSNPRAETDSLSQYQYQNLNQRHNNHPTHRSITLFKRRRLPTRILEGFFRGSHGILRKQGHLAFLLQHATISYPNAKAITKHRKQQNIHYDSTTPKPTTPHPPSIPSAQQQQSDRAAP